ncbi:MAG: uroporphyrinogen-III synthase [FCB group bacterium]|nr:uroporphyrinogen-III synthase [FCB group bacterium]
MTPTILYTGLSNNQALQSLPDGIGYYHVPTIRIEYEHPEDFAPVLEWLNREPYVVFFSKNGVIGLERWVREEGLSLPLNRATVWAVGKATAGMVRETFGLSAVQPPQQNSAGLIQAFETLSPKPVVLFSARKSRPQFPQWLEKRGWEYLRVVVYTTRILANKSLPEHFRNKPDEYIVFTSPSTVKGFLKSTGLPNLESVDSRLISIGPATSAEIRSSGGHIFEELVTPDIKNYLTRIVRLQNERA